jgi:hypothetical protein
MDKKVNLHKRLAMGESVSGKEEASEPKVEKKNMREGGHCSVKKENMKKGGKKK